MEGMLWLQQRSHTVLESCGHAAFGTEYQHGKAATWRTVSWVLFASLLQTMINDSEIMCLHSNK